MKQWKALMLGILCAAGACIFLFDEQYACMTLFAIGALLFLGIWLYKHQRDQRILAQAEQERQRATQTPLALPPMTSEGNRRLFVPPPLQQGK